ncbi:sugar ABC transporter permease [Paenibacillus terrae HPL-003]|uniref:Sugar ABC transporter permease n=1 Tax=Paenibacillus terrae (strain HPL-003) TaxID=985665 RepID=G7VWG4_PAETH|nr:sugar ABC transporter permease [Paenibacillus terrae HPL-003]
MSIGFEKAYLMQTSMNLPTSEIIPTYLLVKNLGMLDTVWAILLPGAINVWDLILARTFFKGVSD